MVQESTSALVSRVLGDDTLDLHVEQLKVEENFDAGHCTADLVVTGMPGHDQAISLSGKGVGVVDAVFHALKDTLSREYPSLNSIRFSGFEIRADFNTRKDDSGSDAAGTVVLVVESSSDRRFEFAHTSRSITASMVIATLQASEYFVNTERAFILLHRALDDARARNRSDLVTRYNLEMAEIVENTSYSEVIERLRSETP